MPVTRPAEPAHPAFAGSMADWKRLPDLHPSTLPEAIAADQRQAILCCGISLQGFIDIPAVCAATILCDWVVRRRLAELGLVTAPVAKARPLRPHVRGNMQAVIDALKARGGEATTRQVADDSGLLYKKVWDYLTGNPRHFLRLTELTKARYPSYRWRLRSPGDLRPQSRIAPTFPKPTQKATVPT